MPHELFIYDEIGPSEWGLIDGKLMAAALADIPADAELTVRINSPGGDVFQGLNIYELLRERPGPTAVRVDALAGSIASIIALAGNPILIAPTAYFAIHKPQTIAGGEAASLRRAADLLDNVEDTALDVYAARSNGLVDRETLREWLTEETWLNAGEAIAVGFADQVTEAGSSNGNMVSANLGSGLVQFKRVPAGRPVATRDRQQAAQLGLRGARREILTRKIDLRRSP